MFTQDGTSNIYTIAQASKYNYIPKVSIDSVDFNGTSTNCSYTLNDTTLLINLSDGIAAENGDVKVYYHMNDDSANTYIKTAFTITSSPEINLSGVTFSNTESNKSFIKSILYRFCCFRDE